MPHFHVWQRARCNPHARHEQIGHSLATLRQARRIVQEYRLDRGTHYSITHSGLCRCDDAGPVVEA